MFLHEGVIMRQDPTSRRKESVLISLVVPVFNEEEAVSTFLRCVEEELGGQYHLEIVFVNDGSSDKTLQKLLAHQRQDPRIRIVDLTRNFGKEAALTAGIELCRGDAVVPIDVDLQDPPHLVHQMMQKWQEGYDVVLARRTDRQSDS